MTVKLEMHIKNLQKYQAANLRRIAMLQPDNEAGEVVRDISIFAHAEAVKVTHVDTGALRASHRIKVSSLRGEVFISQHSKNPRTKELVRDYAEIEHLRGGGHAFYDRAMKATDTYAAKRFSDFVVHLAAGA